MVSRHTAIYALFFTLTGTIAVLGPTETRSAPALTEGAVPAEAVAALRQGRHLRASLILREYLAARPDSSPSVIMLAAEAEAGLGDWERVSELLTGQPWLDRVAAGYGWNLLGRSQVELGRYREGSNSLGRYLSMTESAGSREGGVTLVRRAVALAEQRDARAALAAFDRAAEQLPQIEDWLHVQAASAAAAVGDTAEVRERLAQVDPLMALEWSWRTRVRAYRAADDVAGALAHAEHAAQRLSTEARRAAAWATVGSLRLARRDRQGAREAWTHAIRLAPGTSAALDAARGLSDLGALTPEDELRVGRVFLRHGNTKRGLAGLGAYLASGRGTPAEREAVAYEVANVHFRAGQHAAAEKALLAVAGVVSERRVAAEAMYTAARAQYRDGRRAPALHTLERIIREYGDQPAAVRAAYLAADLHHDARELDRATELYRAAIRMDPRSDEAAIARMRIGGIALAAGRYEEALREFEDYRRTHTSGRAFQQATYWSGRALEQLGRAGDARQRLAEARAIDPFSYYGGLAGDDLGDHSWHERLEHAPAVTGRFDAQVEAALARVDLLRDIGWSDIASFEMERVRRHFAQVDGALYALAEKLNERGFTSAGVALGWEIRRREGAWNTRLLRIVYPFPYQNIILAEAQDRGVDPFLAAALIRQESMFNPRARSPVGAVGLMQVMPATGSALARRLGVPRFKPDMLLQPELNIHFGMAYLADQLRAHGSRTDAVLAAYNAGPGRVARWRQFPEWHDRRLFAERIPFDETRDYVRIVQNNRRMYAALYGSLLTAPADE